MTISFLTLLPHGAERLPPDEFRTWGFYYNLLAHFDFGYNQSTISLLEAIHRL